MLEIGGKGSKNDTRLDSIGIQELLIIYKYFFYAIQKIDKKYFKQEMNEINDDLLFEFKEMRTVNQKKKKNPGITDYFQKSVNFEDENEFPPLPNEIKSTKKPGIHSEKNKNEFNIFEGNKPKKPDMDKDFPALKEDKISEQEEKVSKQEEIKNDIPKEAKKIKKRKKKKPQEIQAGFY